MRVKFTQDFTKRSRFVSHIFRARVHDNESTVCSVLGRRRRFYQISFEHDSACEEQIFSHATEFDESRAVCESVFPHSRTGVRRAPFAIETKVAERSKTAVVATIRAGK